MSHTTSYHDVSKSVAKQNMFLFETSTKAGAVQSIQIQLEMKTSHLVQADGGVADEGASAVWASAPVPVTRGCKALQCCRDLRIHTVPGERQEQSNRNGNEMPTRIAKQPCRIAPRKRGTSQSADQI